VSLDSLLKIARRLNDADREVFFALVAETLRPLARIGFNRRIFENAVFAASRRVGFDARDLE
jgi:hypothetical protein